ncbi:lanthionine synthetase C family protein [Undibacterium sp.]|jgi:lantibiotic modifying enzyme|uniref:lanthionine synthetase C family protein n=1 Tax=Undibacterium sp. TaxID=1914977 RepID=UPI002D0A85D8|nr:lanthionine synthetase C family protein [Undibacterium sp.]HTD05216.1 lanthionine synthetase C family protein [Undibacterium sp.]
MNTNYFHDGRLADATSLVLAIEAQLRPEIETLRFNASLSGGAAGLALFYAKLRAQFPDPAFDEMLAKIEAGIYVLCSAGRLRDLRLFTGLTGVGFALEHIAARQSLPIRELEELNDDLDEIIDEILNKPWGGHYDLVWGLVGIGVYALSRHRTNSRQRLFQKVYAQLMKLATRSPAGLSWRTQPKFLGYESKNGNYPDGNFNLGLAHGNPGVISLLSAAIGMGVDVPGIHTSLQDATCWLLGQGMSGALSRFGYVVDDKIASRLSWCYGDLTISLAVIQSGKVLNDEKIIQQGVEIGLDAAARTAASAQLNDHGLCHGFAGVGLVFSALHREVGHPAFQAAARGWYGYTLDAGGASLNNLQTLRDDGSRGLDAGALCGLSGIGLALLDAMNTQSDGWSKWMMI